MPGDVSKKDIFFKLLLFKILIFNLFFFAFDNIFLLSSQPKTLKPCFFRNLIELIPVRLNPKTPTFLFKKKFILFFYLSLSVANPINAKITAKIQNLITIVFSCHPFFSK